MDNKLPINQKKLCLICRKKEVASMASEPAAAIKQNCLECYNKKWGEMPRHHAITNGLHIKGTGVNKRLYQQFDQKRQLDLGIAVPPPAPQLPPD